MKDAAPLLTAQHHAVRFYENDRALAQIVAQFLSDGLAAGSPGIVVATPAHRGAILKELVAKSLDVVQLQRSHDLVFLDAQETLAIFMTDGKPEAEAFQNSMCEVIKMVCRLRANCTVRIYGEMVDVLWKNDQQEAAIRLEILWNQLANSKAFSLLCGYAMGHFYKDASVQEVCRHHTHVVSADGEMTAVA
jgi:predicted GNAT family N-acyltransferase